ncbi:MAG: tRNA (N6-isopentenyl adenosine(37)-C2)-methylthiotransferase MiaB [Candidatus Omnitrophica bacterium CG07_land_8_20_14_0_80_50_8]|nr:MAG: tRNA (N6-isopentenyl adenosine(37)-C2)-methylthiotransferase MiaB [Candidatus Omnitrophica bacterium CG07_land_8_20_14_0_80_50_8]
MNERDSEGVQGLLLGRGYEETPFIEEANLVLYNTCSVRDHAEQKIFGRIGEFRKLKERNPELIVGIIGCMAQQYGKKLLNKNSEIDFVCGPGNLDQIPELVEGAQRSRLGTTHGAALLAIDRLNGEYSLEDVHYHSGNLKALVNIMTGCDHRCTYCIVPFTRGRERSRSSENILNEMSQIQERGFKDVMLLGQNVNGYGKGLAETVDFVELLKRIQERTPAIPRLRFITSHPKDAHTRLFGAMRDLPMVCEHLHLPVQAGANRTLKRMKREHTRQWYLEQIGEYRALVPGGTLTTDFIVGFPGETEKDFLETLELAQKVEFDSAFIFQYSPRPGTPSLKLGDDVPADEKHRRHQALLAAQKAASLKRNQALIGESVEVLFESKTKRDENRFVGRTRGYKRVVAGADRDIIGEFLPVKISAVADETLLGEL